MAEENSFIDAESQSSSTKERLTYPFILMSQVDRCARLGSVDFSGGYWLDKSLMLHVGAAGQEVIVHSYHESSSLAFVNSVLTLYDMISGHANTELKNYYEDATKKILECNPKGKDPAGKEVTFDDGGREFLVIHRRKAQIARGLFQACMIFLKKKNYFQNSGMGITD